MALFGSRLFEINRCAPEFAPEPFELRLREFAQRARIMLMAGFGVFAPHGKAEHQPLERRATDRRSGGAQRIGAATAQLRMKRMILGMAAIEARQHHIGVTRGREACHHIAQLGAQLRDNRGIRNRREQRQRACQTPQREPALMQRGGIALHGDKAIVAQQMLERMAGQRAPRIADIAVGREQKRFGLADSGFRRTQQCKAAFGFRAERPAQIVPKREHQRELIKCRRIARFEFEFQFADRCLMIGCADQPGIERGFNHCARPVDLALFA